MIGGAAVSYDRLTPFPGFAALLPCFGTALLIAWSRLQSRIVTALSNPRSGLGGPDIVPVVSLALAAARARQVGPAARACSPRDCSPLSYCSGPGGHHLALHRETNMRTKRLVAHPAPVCHRGRSHVPCDLRRDGATSDAGAAPRRGACRRSAHSGSGERFRPLPRGLPQLGSQATKPVRRLRHGRQGPARIRLRALGRLACWGVSGSHRRCRARLLIERPATDQRRLLTGAGSGRSARWCGDGLRSPQPGDVHPFATTSRATGDPGRRLGPVSRRLQQKFAACQAGRMRASTARRC
jgi:hypothetical protein